MSNAVTQQIPLTLVMFALSANVMGNHRVLGSSNVASLEWKTTEELPTQCSPSFVEEAVLPAASSAGLSLRALAQVVLPDSRPMEDWEKKAADDFFWSQFA